jgi:hypothetical protein
MIFYELDINRCEVIVRFSPVKQIIKSFLQVIEKNKSENKSQVENLL